MTLVRNIRSTIFLFLTIKFIYAKQRTVFFRIRFVVMHHSVHSMCMLRGCCCSGCASLAHDALTCLYLIVPLLSGSLQHPLHRHQFIVTRFNICHKTSETHLVAYEIYFKLFANCLECVLLLDTECLTIIYDKFQKKIRRFLPNTHYLKVFIMYVLNT